MRRASWVLLAVLGGLVSTASAQDQIRWQPNIETATRVAAQTNRLVLIHCWAPWCGPCLQLEKEVFGQAAVGKSLEANFVCVKLNVEESPATARMYHVTHLPTDVIITPTSRLVAQLQSPPTAQQYVEQINRIADGHKQLVANGGGGGAPGAAPAVAATAGAMAAAAPPAPPIQQTAMAPPAPPVAQSPGGYGPGPGAAPAPARYTDDRYAHVLNNGPPAQPPAAAAPAPDSNYAGGPYGPAAPTAWQTQQPAGGAPPVAPPAAPSVPPQVPLSNYAQQPYQGMAPPPAQAPQLPTNPSPAQPPIQPPVVQPVASAPAVQLPPGSPALGLEGYCPVTLTEERRWLPGDRRWGAIHRGRTYLFSGPSQQQRFMANPDIYSPVMSGDDPVLALDARQQATGRREHGVFFEHRIYLFATEQSLDAFNKNPKRYAAEVMQAMR